LAEKIVAEAVSNYGAKVKPKLANIAVGGAPEDQLCGKVGDFHWQRCYAARARGEQRPGEKRRPLILIDRQPMLSTPISRILFPRA
jgi:hypothetical protein